MTATISSTHTVQSNCQNKSPFPIHVGGLRARQVTKASGNCSDPRYSYIDFLHEVVVFTKTVGDSCALRLLPPVQAWSRNDR